MTLGKKKDKTISKQISALFTSRLKYLLQERGISYDVINTVINLSNKSDNINTIVITIKLAEFIHAEKENLKGVTDTAIRLKNILKSQNLNTIPDSIDNSIEQSKEEKTLSQFISETLPSTNDTPIELNLDETLSKIKQLQDIVEQISQLFDNVMILDENEKIKQNRLALVKKLDLVFNLFANFTELVYSK